MLWGFIIAAAVLMVIAALLPKEKRFNYDDQGLPVCPVCGVSMDLLEKRQRARCHDCRRIFRAAPDADAQETKIALRDLQRRIRETEEHRTRK